MPAIITDQFRITNAETFSKSLVGIGTTVNEYYTFLGHPNPENDIPDYGNKEWGTADKTPDPKDSFKQENLYYDSMLFLSKIIPEDVARVVPRVNWESGITYDMYKNNYNINNKAPNSGASSLYTSRFYVITSEFKVYACINNGSGPDFPKGKKSTQEPKFVSNSVQVAGDGSDDYLWKYLFTMKPSDIIKFATETFMPLPNNWGDGDTKDVKDAAVDGKIETVIIANRGAGYQWGGSSNATIPNVPIHGNGEGATADVEISDGEVVKVTMNTGGSSYTYGTLVFQSGRTYGANELSGPAIGDSDVATFEVIIPPQGGHGHDIYRELGGLRVMVYSKFESEDDYVTGNDFSRVGIVKNPTAFGTKTTALNSSTATNLGALKLGIANTSFTDYPVNSKIIQNIGIGSTAIGYVASWSKTTGVLRYYQPTGLTNTSNSDYKLLDFSPQGTDKTIIGDASMEGTALDIDTTFTNTNTITVGQKIIGLGQNFVNGKANPDVEKYSGEIIYIDNRAPITRSASQKEEVKIVVEF